MRFREVSGSFPDLSRISNTERRGAGALSASSRADEAGRAFEREPRATPSRLASPTEQVVLEVPALRARRLVRLQVASIVEVSIDAGLL
jgi:hypothetical protein